MHRMIRPARSWSCSIVCSLEKLISKTRGRIRLIWSWCSTSHGSLLDRLVWFGQTVKSAGSFHGPGARIPLGGAGIRTGQGGFAPARRVGGPSARLALVTRVSRPASHQRPSFIAGSYRRSSGAFKRQYDQDKLIAQRNEVASNR
jgi:hypothetical protein